VLVYEMNYEGGTGPVCHGGQGWSGGVAVHGTKHMIQRPVATKPVTEKILSLLEALVERLKIFTTEKKKTDEALGIGFLLAINSGAGERRLIPVHMTS